MNQTNTKNYGAYTAAKLACDASLTVHIKALLSNKKLNKYDYYTVDKITDIARRYKTDCNTKVTIKQITEEIKTFLSAQKDLSYYRRVRKAEVFTTSLEAKLHEHKRNIIYKKLAAVCSSNVVHKSISFCVNSAEDMSIDSERELNFNDMRGQWAKAYTNLVFTVTKNVQAKNFEIIGGMLTYFINRKSGKCVWFEKSRGYSFKTKCGYLIGDLHVETDSKIVAVKAYKKQLDKLKKLTAKLQRTWVTVADSIAAGNCKSGTDNFIAQANLSDWGAIRSDYLIELAEKFGVVDFAQRAIKASNHTAV